MKLKRFIQGTLPIGFLTASLPLAAHQLNQDVPSVSLSIFASWHNIVHVAQSWVTQYSLALGAGLILIGSILIFRAIKTIHLQHKLVNE